MSYLVKKTDKIEKRTYGINRFFIALSARLIGFFDNIPEKKKKCWHNGTMYQHFKFNRYIING